MKSPTNPSADDIRHWAFTLDPHEPCQDWDLILSWGPYRNLYLDLAGDSNCPKQNYFTQFLYFLVARAIHDHRIEEMKEFALTASHNRPFAVHQWAVRTLEALNHPDRFSDKIWNTYAPTD